MCRAKSANSRDRHRGSSKSVSIGELVEFVQIIYQLNIQILNILIIIIHSILRVRALRSPFKFENSDPKGYSSCRLKSAETADNLIHATTHVLRTRVIV